MAGATLQHKPRNEGFPNLTPPAILSTYPDTQATLYKFKFALNLYGH